MTTCSTIRPAILRCMEPGELGQPVAAFIAHLTSLGYSSLTISGCAASARHLGAWLKQSGIPASEVDDRVLDRFAQHRCHCEGNRRSDRLSGKYVGQVRHFVRFLAEQGVVRASPAIIPPLDPSVALFMDWLRRHRGLSERTIDRHARMVSRLLPALGTDPGAYDARRVRGAILAEATRCSPETIKTMTTALRAYLRYLATTGACRAGLDYAVPSTPVWRLSALPRYLPPADVERLIASCNVTGMPGIRDKAILLLLARLGLRAHDVWAMELDDVAWISGMVRVCGKGRREVRLPLSQEVGDTLLDYIERGRPPVEDRRIFLRSAAPWRPLKNSGAISGVVRSSLRRAGITDAPSQGANLLRHSAATSMLRAGATLEAIGTVLRHRSPDTTAHYAKVDVATLRRIAQPWPGDL